MATPTDAKPAPVQAAQPPAQMPMSIYGPTHPVAKPNPHNLPLDANGQREWNHSLWNCTDRCDVCCMSCWCPCIVYGRSATRIQHLQLTGQPHPEGGEPFGQQTLMYYVIATIGCNWIMDMTLRTLAKKRYNIAGSDFKNCMTACCCLPCLQTQLVREIEDEEATVRQGPPANGTTDNHAPTSQYPTQSQLPAYNAATSPKAGKGAQQPLQTSEASTGAPASLPPDSKAPRT